MHLNRGLKQKISILYADTGGGHRSSGEAISQGIEIAYPGQFEVSFVNNFRSWPFPFSIAEDIYPPLVNHARPVYKATFRATNHKNVTATLRRMFEPLSEKLAAEMLAQYPADLYLSVHPLYNQVLPAAIRETKARAKYVSVVTDLVTGHVQWYHQDVHRCIVPTSAAFEQAVHFGIPRDHVRIGGQPVWPDFAKRMTAGAQTRAALGLDPNIPVALLMGGGDGMGRLEGLARNIAWSGLPLQLIVVCGRNVAVMQALEFVRPRIPAMRVLGFVRNVPELMGASDVLITKAGPGTICEGFVAGLPIILYDAIPGQEEGNIALVEEQGAGVYCKSTRSVLRQLEHWLGNKEAFHTAKISSSQLARPDAAVEIARLSIEMLA